MNNQHRYFFICLFFTCLSTACKKSAFLDAKPSTSLTVPTTLADCQSLMDNYNLINQSPALGDMSSDNYFYDFDSWQSVTAIPQNCYLWSKDIYGGSGSVPDWDLPYQQVLVANIVLEGLARIDIGTVDAALYHDVMGSALFIRANAFYGLAQVFAPPYDSASAGSDLGIPLHLSSDVNVNDKRATVAGTYAQIILDLDLSKNYLRGIVPGADINRPIRPAAYALLSKVYLSMRAYGLAGLNADSSLQLYSALIDYNGLSAFSYVPFARTNAETMCQGYQVSVYPVDGADGVAQVDSLLYRSYSANDLRKQLFYYVTSDSTVFLKGTYNGTFNLFSGFATNEMYLNRAECHARMGNAASAMADLNALLSQRFITGTYIPFADTDPLRALANILTERRKELPFSSVRWTDLRRLNKEGAAIAPKRLLNGRAYLLPPNSPLYVLPIPPDEIALSGIAQNAR